MKERHSRRTWFQKVAAGTASVWLASRGRSSSASPSQAPGNGTVSPLTSTSDVLVPPRGRSFMKLSFDFPEPSVSFEGLSLGFRVFTYENVFGLDPERLTVEAREDGLVVRCSRFVWAGGQERAPGRLEALVLKAGGGVEVRTTVEMDAPIKAAAVIVRGVPRGMLSCAGQRFFDPKDDEVLMGYPFSGGDLFGPGAAMGMPTPIALVKRREGEYFFLSSRDDRVRAKRFYFQPGESSYRVEAVFETEGWTRPTRVVVPPWRFGRTASVGDAVRPHVEHLERAYRLPRWETREDAPSWLREIALVVTLHGMHYTGYVFNDYARTLEILRWIAARIPARRVLAFLAAWDGRYYWDYPSYEASERMGGEAGFRTLVREGQALGFRMMPMFGANTANRNQSSWSRFSDAFTEKIDGDRADLNWVDWDNDRHQDGWLSYMNLGVDSWRLWLTERIASVVERFGVDAYFLDIAGGWINNPKADMHEGTRRLVLDLRARFPGVVAVGEMHYDALLEFLPLYHSFSQVEIAPHIQRFGRFFQHLSLPAPGRGSTGVHEAGFQRFNPDTLGLTEFQIPTLGVVDDTFERHRPQMEAVIDRARARA